jgi:hypothetical protein
MTTTSSTDTCTSDNRGYATRRVRALAEGKYRSRSLRHRLALRLQSWRGCSPGISRRPRRRKGVRTYTWQSPGGVRNIRRGDPSTLNTRQSAMMDDSTHGGVSTIGEELPGSFTEDMLCLEKSRKEKRREGGKRGVEGRGEWAGEYKARRSLRVIGSNTEIEYIVFSKERGGCGSPAQSISYFLSHVHYRGPSPNQTEVSDGQERGNSKSWPYHCGQERGRETVISVHCSNLPYPFTFDLVAQRAPSPRLPPSQPHSRFHPFGLTKRSV